MLIVLSTGKGSGPGPELIQKENHPVRGMACWYVPPKFKGDLTDINLYIELTLLDYRYM